MHIDELRQKSGRELIDIALAADTDIEFWWIVGMASAAFHDDVEIRGIMNKIYVESFNNDKDTAKLLLTIAKTILANRQ